MSNFKDFFCYKGLTSEWVIYLVVELAFIVFFIISCYNADKLNRLHEDDISLKYGLNVAIECTVVFIGLYLGFIWYTGRVSTLQVCFCGHIAPFLIVTGITALITTAKRIQTAPLAPSALGRV